MNRPRSFPALIVATRAFDPLKDYILKHYDRYALFHVKDGIYDDTEYTKPKGSALGIGVVGMVSPCA